MGFELYDLDSDPYETNNIYKHAPQVRTRGVAAGQQQLLAPARPPVQAVPSPNPTHSTPHCIQSLVEYLVESLNSLKICAGSELCSIQNVTQLIEAQQVGLPGWRRTAASEALGGGRWHAQAWRVDVKCPICSLLLLCVACR